MSPVPLSLYIHFPWCVRKCPYCDFNSHALRGELAEDNYINLLIRDFEFEITNHPPETKISSIFMGGGTPSLFSAGSLNKLLTFIRNSVNLSDDCEITMEANPGTLEHHSFESCLNAGINRLSIGVQSFNPVHLEVLGRIHGPGEASSAITNAKRGGFSNINIDLMYGLPQQTRDMACQDIEQAIDADTPHISLYQLTVEPNTLFHRFPPTLPKEDEIFEMQTELFKLLDKSGFEQYEISAYSRPGFRCQHNLNYWNFGDYIGIGAGAHGKYTTHNNARRYWKMKHPDQYRQTAGTRSVYGDDSPIHTGDLLFEFLMNGLRLKQGVRLSTLYARCETNQQKVLLRLRRSRERELVEITSSHLRCTEKGYLFLDEVLQDLLPDKTAQSA